MENYELTSHESEGMPPNLTNQFPESKKNGAGPMVVGWEVGVGGGGSWGEVLPTPGTQDLGSTY